MSSIATYLAIAVLLASFAAPAQSQDHMQAAADAFRRGQHAQLAGDYARAARFFEIANELVPSPEALRSAIRNYRASGNDVAAAQLAAHALTSDNVEDRTRQLSEELLAELAPQLGRVNVTCEPACGLVVDESAVSTERREHHSVFVTAAAHTLIATWSEGRSERREVSFEAGQEQSLELEAPPLPEPEEPEPEPEPAPASTPEVIPAVSIDRVEEEGSGVSPALFFVTLGLSAAAGGLYVWSLLDTLEQRDAYIERPTEKGYEDGIAAERRTIIVGGVAAGLALTALGLAIFGTDWSGSEESEPDPGTLAGFWIEQGGGGLTLRHALPVSAL